MQSPYLLLHSVTHSPEQGPGSGEYDTFCDLFTLASRQVRAKVRDHRRDEICHTGMGLTSKMGVEKDLCAEEALTAYIDSLKHGMLESLLLLTHNSSFR